MNTIETVRHRVAIAGQVIDSFTSKAIGQASIAITDMPPVFRKRLDLQGKAFAGRWKLMAERPDRTLSRSDGLFYFLDLPDGDYGLQISAPGYGKRYGTVERKVKVARDASGTFKLSWAIVGLAPTAVKGSITTKKVNVSFAQVRLKGSGECAFSDDAGQYVIAGIEPGKRTLLVSAQGYRPVAQQVLIATPGDSQTVNFSLLRDGG